MADIAVKSNVRTTAALVDLVKKLQEQKAASGKQPSASEILKNITSKSGPPSAEGGE